MAKQKRVVLKDNFVVSIRLDKADWEALGMLTKNRSALIRHYISRTIQRKKVK